MREASHLGTLVRFADDGVILCRTRDGAQQALEWLQETAQALKLSLHPEKTRIVELREGAEGFDFLGFHNRLVKSRRYKGWYCQRWPSKRAMASIRTKIKEILSPRYRLKEPVQTLVTEVNRIVRGWGNYFRNGNSAKKFSQIDDYPSTLSVARAPVCQAYSVKGPYSEKPPRGGDRLDRRRAVPRHFHPPWCQSLAWRLERHRSQIWDHARLRLPASTSS